MEHKDINFPILFFDGICGLCNSFVNFLLKADSSKKLIFAPLQGETAQILLPQDKIAKMESLVFWENGIICEKSKAIIAILHLLGGPWKILLIFDLLPSLFLDKLYDVIAKSRYSIFGKMDQCRLLNKEEAQRFLN